MSGYGDTAAKAAAERSKNKAMEPSKPPKAQEAAQRRSNQKRWSNDMQDSAELREYRRKKIAAGDYRGKYYGPDQFKGDMEKLKAWRRAGSPADVNAYVNRTKEQQKGYGRGQNTEKNYRPYRGAGDGLSAPKKVYGRGPNTGKQPAPKKVYGRGPNTGKQQY